MRQEVFRSDRAKRDLVEKAEWLEERNPDAADRFLEAVESLLERVKVPPGMGVARMFNNPSLEGLRMMPVPEFEKHLVFYKPVDGGIRLVRVLHSSQDIRGIFEA